MLKLLRLLAAFLIFLIIVGIALVYFLNRPYAGFQNEVFVDIPKGTSTTSMATLLKREGVIKYEWQFLIARAFHPRSRLPAGEYAFRKPASPLEVFDRIARGDVFYYELAVPEGQNMFDIAASLERLGATSAAEFLKAARDPSIIRDLDPGAPTLEGYLFPDTYRITRHTSASELTRHMTARFRKAWQELRTKADVHRTVTLASLIEKEAAAPEERPLIASVFENRLRNGMALGCDPTTVYAALLDANYRGSIYRSDLESKNPYNTYTHAGLPPGPIANPGVASIKAALDPAQTNYLYFVVRPDAPGRHEFSTELTAHHAAAAKYRRASRKEIKETATAGVRDRKKSQQHR